MDGVDVIFFSVGGDVVFYDVDGIVIGVFGVVKRGIFVFCLGGNSGFEYGMVLNIVLWMMIVGVNMLDCFFFVNVVFGVDG